MINEPLSIVHNSFQQAWLQVVTRLMASQWDLSNLVVQVRDPSAFDTDTHDLLDKFARTTGILPPRHVAYTIFPIGLYRHNNSAEQVFASYNRPNGLYERLHRRKKDWGTYFRRMTHYDGRDGTPVNQLGNIVNAFRTRRNISRAAYTLIIQHPGGETMRPLGGPCLNYLAVQATPQPFTVGLLAVYRNHDFLERAYGNYWGLCSLLAFIAGEVEAAVGPLTCVSSHAYVSKHKARLRTFVEGV